MTENAYHTAGVLIQDIQRLRKTQTDLQLLLDNWEKKMIPVPKGCENAFKIVDGVTYCTDEFYHITYLSYHEGYQRTSQIRLPVSNEAVKVLFETAKKEIEDKLAEKERMLEEL